MILGIYYLNVVSLLKVTPTRPKKKKKKSLSPGLSKRCGALQEEERRVPCVPSLCLCFSLGRGGRRPFGKGGTATGRLATWEFVIGGLHTIWSRVSPTCEWAQGNRWETAKKLLEAGSQEYPLVLFDPVLVVTVTAMVMGTLRAPRRKKKKTDENFHIRNKEKKSSPCHFLSCGH